MSVGPGVAKQLRGVLEDVPHVQHAFAYGSGVIVQPDLYDRHSTNKPMLDFIFAVDNPYEWHAQVGITCSSDAVTSLCKIMHAVHTKNESFGVDLCRICNRTGIITPSLAVLDHLQ